MKYNYKCQQGECEKVNEIVVITKPMAESSKIEFCEECNHELQRVFNSPGIKTFGDGYKA